MAREVSRFSARRRDSTTKGGGGDNFKVAVRVRPLIAQELRAKAISCVEVDVEHKAISIRKPESRRRSSQIGIDDFGELVRSDTSQSHNFFFDIVFPHQTIQEHIFDVCAKDIVESVLQGYNASVIASGQTDIENYPSRSDKFLVRVSFLEIYNEKISDLLDPTRENLKIREGGADGVFVEGLSEPVVRNTRQILDFLAKGTQIRTTAVTRMNKESSRSHAVFTVIVEHGEYDSSGGIVVTIGKLRLVDLAGSERLDVEAHGKVQEETKNINVSLHTFGKVVTALTTPGAKHIPYRDSKLTRLLQDSLGGNCKTTLIATITPTPQCYTESLNTLKFAKRAKNIKNRAQINQDMSQKAMLSAYQNQIKKLKEELERRDEASGRMEIERLQKEREAAWREKDAVQSQLEVHQQMVKEAQAERDELLTKIHQLEKAFLHSGSSSISESEEFKEAILQEEARIRRETETQLEGKLAELESERKRLEDERAEIQRQKEYFAKMRAEFKPDGENTKDQGDAAEEIERGSSPVKPHSSSGQINPLLKKPSTPPFTLGSRPPPSGAHIPSRVASPFPAPPPPRRIASADTLPPRGIHISPGIRHHSWVHPHMDYERCAMEVVNPLTSYGLQAQIRLDDASAMALLQYAKALSHPHTGIPCQVVSGTRIFTGSAAVKWFMTNMEGVSTVQIAQDVGQRLMELSVFMEIQGGQQFIVSAKTYYQFCDTAAAVGATQTPPMLSRPGSSVSIDPYSYGSHASLHSARQRSSPLSNPSGAWTLSSTTSLNQSLSSLHIGGDLLEHFGLTQYSPTQLHVAAIYGDRSQLKLLAQQLEVDCLDTAGHTPLMYAVKGRQPKCCLQLLRLGANVDAANQSGQTPLLLATAAECEDIVKILLKNGAQTHFVDQEGQTAFHIAAKSQNYRCLEYLCKYATVVHGINERDHHYLTPLHIAVTSNLPGHVKRLLMAKADLGVSDRDGRTALHYAVTTRSLPCVQTIVETRPNDVNLVDTMGWSAIHLACEEETTDIGNYLMSSPSCDINLRDQNGCSPLHIAAKVNNSAMVKLLVQKGAIVHLKDSNRKTALHYSMELGFTECSHVLQLEK